jgi:hypothetical protein
MLNTITIMHIARKIYCSKLVVHMSTTPIDSNESFNFATFYGEQVTAFKTAKKLFLENVDSKARTHLSPFESFECRLDSLMYLNQELTFYPDEDYEDEQDSDFDDFDSVNYEEESKDMVVEESVDKEAEEERKDKEREERKKKWIEEEGYTKRYYLFGCKFEDGNDFIQADDRYSAEFCDVGVLEFAHATQVIYVQV